MKNKRHVFCVSDGTGITATMLSNSLLSQFEHTEFITSTHPYVDDEEKIKTLLQQINTAFLKDNAPPIVFTTIVKPDLLTRIQASPALVLDFFDSFIGPLEKALGEKSSHTIGRSHGMVDYLHYKKRIDALNFSLNTDDGSSLHQYNQADIILIGVSRCGKTPTSLYLSMQYGLFVANYPITDDEIHAVHLPKALQAYSSKLFGLTIDLEQLITIRQERKPNSQYASRAQCQTEIQRVEQLFSREKIPFLNSTFLSVEELATKIKHYFKLDGIL